MATDTKIFLFLQLCECFEKVRMSNVRNEKIRILRAFVDKCKKDASEVKNSSELEEMMYPVYKLILPKNVGNHKKTLFSLVKLYTESFSLPKKSQEYESLINYQSSTDKFEGNDFAERVYSVIKKFLPQKSTGITIAEINKFLDDIDNKNATMQQKVESFRIISRQITGFEMKWLTRILLKDLQLGIKTENIQEFLNTNFSNTNWNRWLKDKCVILSFSTGMKESVQTFFYFKPMLLERLNYGDISKLFPSMTSMTYYVQVKFDGERSQIHMSRGKYKYFTRNGVDITEKPLLGETADSGYLSGKFAQFLDQKCSSFILDGELMVWDKKKKVLLTKGMPVDVKYLSRDGSYRPCFVAFDIVMYNDASLLDTPYNVRLNQLQRLLTRAHGAISVSETTLISDRTQLENIFCSKCIQEKEEGIVVKRYNFLYQPNVRNGGGCYKIKAEYSDDLAQDLDLIILGGSYTKHKSPEQLNSLLMGAALPASSKEEYPSSFVAVLSVSNGLSKIEWSFLESSFSSKWIRECPTNISHNSKKTHSYMWLHPKDSLILTIRATEMVPNNKHPIGYSFRFPRIMGIRKDKPWYNMCTSVEILSLVKEKNTVNKLIKTGATPRSLIPNKGPTKLSGRPLENKLKMRAQPRNEQTVHGAFKSQVIHSRLLEGKEICVINGTENFSKEDVEEKLKRYSAKIVNYPTSTTYCTIVGNKNTIRALDVIKNHDSVVSLDWFQRITSNPKSSISLHPLELLSKPKDHSDLSVVYDLYYDHYYDDATLPTLKHSFARIDELGHNIDTSQYSRATCHVFRGVSGFFNEEMVFQQLIFHDYEGTIKENFDNSVTYVFVKDEMNHTVSDLKVYEEAGAQIVRSEWITECFFHDKLVNVEDYLIKTK